MVRGMTSMHTALASRNGGTAGSQAASASIRGLTANSGAPVRQREAAAEVEAALADLGADGGTVELVEHEEDQVGDLAHLDLPHSPRGDRGRAEADAVGIEGSAAMAGEGVGVDGDADAVEGILHC